jgi:HEAT repeat protein
MSVLQSLDRQWVIGVLTTLLADPDPEMRCDAAEALVRIDPKCALDVILPLLNDPVSSVRWHICGLLHDFGDERASAHLVKVLLEDPEGDVRLLAAAALGNVGNHTVIPALRQAQQFDDGIDYEGRRVRDMAAEAIDSILGKENE